MAGLVVLEDFLGGTPGAGVALEGGLRRGDEEGLDGGPDRRAEREGGGHEGGEWHRLEAEAEGPTADAVKIGREVGEQLLAQGGAEIVQQARDLPSDQGNPTR